MRSGVAAPGTRVTIRARRAQPASILSVLCLVDTVEFEKKTFRTAVLTLGVTERGRLYMWTI